MVATTNTVQSMPLLQEPLHAYEKGALQNLGTMQTVTPDMMQGAMKKLQSLIGGAGVSPEASSYIKNAGSATQAALDPITMQEIMGFANPAAGALKSSAARKAEDIRAMLTAKQGLRGGRSFGDTSTGVQMSRLNSDIIDQNAKIDFDIFNKALDTVTGGRNRSLAAGGQYGNLATQAQGVKNAGTQDALGIFGTVNNARVSDLMTQLDAGRYIRGYNQNINDILSGDVAAEQGDKINKISNALNLLKSFESNGGTSYVPGKVSTATKIGTLLSGLDGIGTAGNTGIPNPFGQYNIGAAWPNPDTGKIVY